MKFKRITIYRLFLFVAGSVRQGLGVRFVTIKLGGRCATFPWLFCDKKVWFREHYEPALWSIFVIFTARELSTTGGYVLVSVRRLLWCTDWFRCGTISLRDGQVVKMLRVLHFWWGGGGEVPNTCSEFSFEQVFRGPPLPVINGELWADETNLPAETSCMWNVPFLTRVGGVTQSQVLSQVSGSRSFASGRLVFIVTTWTEYGTSMTNRLWGLVSNDHPSKGSF